MNKNIKKVAIYPGYKNFLKNQMFDLNSEIGRQLGGLPVLERYIDLKNFLVKKGIELHTYDMYENLKEIDLWLVLDLTPKCYLFFLLNFINLKKVIPLIIEPNIVNPWEWNNLRIWSYFHKTILTWSPELINKNKKFIKFHYAPFTFNLERCKFFRNSQKNRMCLLLQSNKTSKVKGELYSLRREIIRYFEKRDDDLFDLLGHGWNSPNTQHLGPSEPFYTNVYKGETDNKWETFSQYKFIFCIQNTIPAGDFESDIFMAIAVGAVPIYLPPPDVDEFIPPNTYINFSNFKNLDDLVSYLKNIINTKEYEDYIKNGWEYINSPKFKPFTVEQFSEDVYNAIKIQEKRSK